MKLISGNRTQSCAPARALAAAAFALLAGVAAAQIDPAKLPAQALNAAATPMLLTEPVGIASVQTWIDKVDLFQTPGAKTWRLMLIKKQTRDARSFTLTTIDLRSQEIKNHPEIAGYGVSKFAWSGAKMYFGTWLPGGFYVYDPGLNVVTALEQPFANKDAGAYRMSVSPDGVVALGAGGGPTELTTYDPKSGTTTRYGVLSARHSYVYELGSDDQYVYAALRGKAPWELVAIDKKTRQRKLLLTAPLEGYINIGGTVATVTDRTDATNAVRKVYDLRGNQAIARNANAEPLAAPAPAAPQPAAPLAVIDDSPLGEGAAEVIVHYQDPAARTNWNRVRIPAPIASEPTLALTALEDGRIAALAGPYNPAVVFDPHAGTGKQAPFSALSGRCMAAVGSVIYASGYPSTVLIRWDTAKPLTDRIDIPGKTYCPALAPQSNPRTCATWPMGPNFGGHMGVRLFKGPNDVIFICTARHRYAWGYDVVWYDPATDTKGEIEDSGRNDHLAITWANPLDGGRRLIVATTVEPNRQLKSPIPESGKLIVVDLVTRQYVAEYTPLPGIRALSGIVEVASNLVVGLALANDNASTYIYRYDLTAQKVVQLVRVAGLMFGQHGTTALPGKGLDFVLGSDNRIWTGMTTSIGVAAVVLINSGDLTVSIPGRIAGTQFRYAFIKGEVFVNGNVKICKVPALSALLAGKPSAGKIVP